MIRTIRVPHISTIRLISLAVFGATLAACASMPTQTAYSDKDGDQIRDCLSTRLGAAGSRVAIVDNDRRGYALSRDVLYEPGMASADHPGTRVEVHSGDGIEPSPEVGNAIAACV